VRRSVRARVQSAGARIAEVRNAEARMAEERRLAARRTGPKAPARPYDVDEFVPVGMRIAGSWAWRIVVLALAITIFVWLVIQLELIVIPVMIAVLLAALLTPLVRFLQRHHVPKGLAVAIAEIGLLAVITGLVVLVVSQIRSGLPDLQAQSVAAYRDFTAFLAEPPFNLSQSELNAYIGDAVDALQGESGALVSGVLSVGSTAGHVAAGILLVLFALLFLLIDGRGIWHWVLRLFPAKARPAVDGSGKAGWVTLTTFVRVQIFVAAVDAIGIGLVAFFLNLPLAVPIGVAVFLGSFIPVVGAVLTGSIAIFIALVYKGPVIALIMLGGVLLVQQVEGHVLQPLVMGTAVKIHPLAVVLGVAGAGFIAGIPGALFAVPVIATLNVMIGYIARGQWRVNPDPDVEDVVPDEDVVPKE